MPPPILACLPSTLPCPAPSPPFSKAQPTIKDLTRKGWHYKIYEDTKEDFNTIMIEHKACTLNLSPDDESCVKARDDRGEWNISPVDGLDAPVRFTTATRASVDLVTDEVRSPLN